MINYIISLFLVCFASIAFAAEPHVDKEKLLLERNQKKERDRSAFNAFRSKIDALSQYDIETLKLALRFKVFDEYNGAIVVVKDEITGEIKLLGKIEDEYSSESIFNEYGEFGGEYSSDSIWNQYGSYGGEYSALSPFNKYSSTPPVIIKNRKILGYLTINKYLNNSIDPNWLKQYFIY